MFNFQTAFTTQWALYLLAKNQKTQQQVINEVKIDARNLECPLVRGTIRESMRLYPVAYFIGRPFGVDGIIDNYAIPSKVTHIINFISKYVLNIFVSCS